MQYSTDDLLSLPAAARRFQVPASWLRAEVQAERIPSLRAGSRLLFHGPTVADLLAARAASLAPREMRKEASVAS